MEKLLAKNIKFLRMREKLSQEQFAFKIDLNRGNIASYEKGTAEPSVSNILKIVKYFNIELVDLVEYDLGLLSELTSSVALKKAAINDDAELTAGQGRYEQIEERSQDLQHIVEGLRKFYLYKKAKGIVDINRVILDYEDLLEVTHSLLVTHQDLLSYLKATDLSSSARVEGDPSVEMGT